MNVKNININITNNDGNTPLYNVVNRGYLSSMVKLLTDKNIDVNKVNTKTGSTPLLIATIKGYKKLIPLLLKKGANINISNNKG